MKTALTAIALLLITLSLSVLVWGFDKAFDLTDAGFYLLRYSDAQAIENGGVLYDSVLIKALLPDSFRQVIPLRFIALGLNLAALLCFTFATLRVLARWGKSKYAPLAVVFCLFAGFMQSYAGTPSELSYNTLNQFLLMSGVAFVSLTFAGRSKVNYLYVGMAGLLFSCMLLSKLPSGLAVMILSSGLLLISDNAKRTLAVFWFVAIVFLAIVYVAVKPDFVHYYLNGMRIVKEGSEYGSGLLLKSIMDAIKLNLKIIIQVVISIGLYRLSTAYPDKRLLKNGLRLLAGISLIALYSKSCGRHFKNAEIIHSDILLTTIYLFVFYYATQARQGIIASFQAARNYVRTNRMLVALMVFMLCIPYAGALGTNNSLNWGAKFYYLPYLAILLMLGSLGSNKIMSGLSILLAVYMILHAGFIYVEHPYRAKPLYAHKYEYKGIKYNLDKYRFLQQTEGMLNRFGFEPGQGLITAYKAPGLVYLMNSHQPGGVLWSEETEDLYFKGLANTALVKKPFVLGLGNPLSASFISRFDNATRWSFSKDYRLVASYPDDSGKAMAYLYVPNLQVHK